MPLFHPLPPSRPGSPPSSPTALLHSQGLPSSTTSIPPFSPSSFAPRRKSINVFHPDTSVPIPPSLQKSPFLTHEASPFRRRSIEPAGKEDGLVGAGGLKGAGGGGGGGTAMMSRFDSGYSEGGGGMGEGSSSDEDSSASENGSGVVQREKEGALEEAENYLPTLLLPLSISINRPPLSPVNSQPTSSGFSSSTSSSSRSPLPLRPTFSRAPLSTLDLPPTPPAVFLPSPSTSSESDSPFSVASTSVSSLVLSIEPSPALSIILPSPGSLNFPKIGHVDTPAIPFGEAGEENEDASGVEERRTGSGYFEIPTTGESKDE